MSFYNLGLLGVCAGLVITGCGDDGNNTGGSGAGGNPSGGSAQGAGPQGAGPQGGDGPIAGSSEGGNGQGGTGQGGAGQGGSSAQGGAGQGGSAAQGGAGQGGSGGAGQGGAGGAPPALTCQTGCEALFDCALEDDSSGTQNCPGLDAGDQAFVVPGCVQQCNNNMALLAIIDPSDCEGTIDTISSISAQFDAACQNGI